MWTLSFILLIWTIIDHVETGITPIRLVEGRTNNEGRVEILYNNTWGTICDDGFDANDAAVLCGMLGYSRQGALALSRAAYGQGASYIWLRDLDCSGNETDVALCGHYGWGNVNCNHAEDASIRCIIKSTSTNVRLVGSPLPNEGRVEIFRQGIWGTVCDDNFDEKSAAVICNMLNMTGSGAQYISRGYFGYGTDTIWLDNVQCNGNEKDIDLCRHNAWGENDCTHFKDVGVMCFPVSASVRLVGGPSPNEGRVEILRQGIWGTVCHDPFDNRIAAVICNMLNITGSDAKPRPFVTPGAHYGLGTGPIWLDDVLCNGNERHIYLCLHNDWGVNDCTHSDDVGVVCDPASTSVRLVGGSSPNKGRVEVLRQGIWGTVCKDNFDEKSAAVICNMLNMTGPGARPDYYSFGPGNGTILLDNVRCNGNERDIDLCYHHAWGYSDCSHSQDVGVVCFPADLQYRLRNGTRSNEGRLEVNHGGVWGTVCDDKFDNNAAKIVCKTLGFANVTALVAPRGKYGPGSGRIWLDDVTCLGNERSIAECYHNDFGVNNCDHSMDVGVICNTACGEWYSSSSSLIYQTLVYTNSTTFGSVAEMTCKPGYVVVNKTSTRSESAVCTENGTWSLPAYSACVPDVQKTVTNCLVNVDSKHRTWNETQPGTIAVEKCPIGYSGNVSRQCSEKGIWLNPFYDCISKAVADLIKTVRNLEKSPSAEKITDSLDQLVNVTKPDNGSSYIGELYAVTDMLDTITRVSKDIGATDKQADSFFSATSNLIDNKNADSWQSGGDQNGNYGSQEEYQASSDFIGAMKVINVVDKYTDILLNSIGNKTDSSTTIHSDNLVVYLTKVNTTAENLKIEEEALGISSSIILPKTSLNGSNSISAVVYKNLTGIVSSKLNNVNDTTINSEVVTITLDNWEKNANFVVDITMEFAQDLRSAPICSFWNKTIFAWDTSGCRVLSSKHSSATCRCTHLTNFAILMSPVIQSNLNNMVLDLISIVGCSISLAGLVLTVVIHLFLWKYCVALASLLHYIYLVVFSIMLVEGIDLALTVLNVLKQKPKLKWMLIAAWVAPAVIVGITLGVTKTEGYGNEISCWLTTKGGVIWAFVGPALFVILVNFVILVIAIRATLTLHAMTKKSTVEKSKSAIWCLLVLMPLMGLTWVLGVFYLDESMAWVQYAFAVCNSLQGLVIFLFNCAFNKRIWKACTTKQKRSSAASRINLNSRSTSFTSAITDNSDVSMTTHVTYEEKDTTGQFANQQQQTNT